MVTGTTMGDRGRARVDVVGMGPAGPGLITARTLALIDEADVVLLRTDRHPSAHAFGGAHTFDQHYERADSFDQVYLAIVTDVIGAALAGRGPEAGPDGCEGGLRGARIADRGRANGVPAQGAPGGGGRDRRPGGPSGGLLPRPGLYPVGGRPGGRRGRGRRRGVVRGGGRRPVGAVAGGPVLEQIGAVGHQAVGGVGTVRPGHRPPPPRA